MRKEVFRPQVWCSNSKRLLRYGGRKFGKFVDAKNFFKMGDSERREATRRQESANNEFGEKKVKVSTKISTGKGMVGYTHLEIACTHHANVELSRIWGGVVKNGFFTVRK